MPTTSFKSASLILGADVADGATFTLPYPAGSVQTDFAALSGSIDDEVMIVNDNDSWAGSKVDFTYGYSTVRVTNNTKTTLRAGSRISLRLPQADPVNPKSVGAGPRVVMFGTSITAQNARNNTDLNNSPSRAFFTDGYAAHARQMLQQRFNLPVEFNFGLSGDTLIPNPPTTIGMTVRQDAVLAVKPDVVMLEAGANDIPVSSFEAMRDAWLQIVRRFRNIGAIVVVIPIPPRAGAALTAAQVKKQQRFTNFQREFCLNNNGVLFADYLGYWLDQTSTASVPLAGMVKADNLHPTAQGAHYMGRAIADLLGPILPPRPSHVLANADIYDATDNFTGNLLYSGTANRGLMAGTGGTETANANLTYTGGGTGGGLATGWSFLRGSSTSVCTVTNTKESPRTDPGRSSGERQVIQIAASSGGGADEVYNLRCSPTFADIAVGDWYYAEAQIEITAAPVNVSALELYLLETRPANSQTAIDGSMNSSLALTLAGVTDGGVPRVYRTPPMQKTADATAIQANVRARLKTDVGAASITFKVADFVVRKVDPTFAP
jgi:lysophospholipase L1-like esterase